MQITPGREIPRGSEDNGAYEERDDPLVVREIPRGSEDNGAYAERDDPIAKRAGSGIREFLKLKTCTNTEDDFFSTRTVGRR
jgi:hypothetical protein